MNYQHAFHAGNFADVVKHALLAVLLRALQRDAAPLFVLDTHAGAGMYALDSAEARRGGEWQDGIGRVAAAADGNAPLDDYRGVIAAANGGGLLRRYPGSPWIVQHLLRPADRLLACESEPEPAKALAALLGRDDRVQVRPGDGWRALRTFLPPRERQGVVLIDPPFEQAAEHARLGRALAAAHRQWPAGTVLGWYPLKRGTAIDDLFREAPAGTDAIEVTIRDDGPGEAGRAGRLQGSGLAVVNPPPGFREQAASLLDALVPLLAPGAVWRGGPAAELLAARAAAVLSSPPVKPREEAPRRDRQEHQRKTTGRPQADGRKPRPRLPRKA